MNRFFKVILFLVTPMLSQGLHLDKHWWHDFDGTLDTTEIQLSIYLMDSGKVEGNYCYKKDESKIKLQGKIKGDTIELTELVNGRPNGRFIGRIFTDSRDRFEGTWTDHSADKSKEFKLVYSSAISRTLPDHGRYEIGTDEEVEGFMKHLRNSILNGDKEWVANHIKYPLRTTLDGQKSITIKNKKQLIDGFDHIFYQTFKNKIKSYCICNMFSKGEGVMLGNGEIWINEGSNWNAGKCDCKITAINN